MLLLETIAEIIESHLEEYKRNLTECNFFVNNSVLEITAKKTATDNSFNLLSIGENTDNQELYIYNIFLPKEDRGRGIGLSLMSLLFQIAKHMDFALVLADLTDSFREKMQKRGAIPTSRYDYLQIVDETYLN